MKRILIAVFAAWTIGAGAETFDTQDHFSISLPDGWIAIPENILDRFVMNVDRLSPDAPAQYYDYGYQLEGGDWLQYPYILVEVLPYGRLPSGELRRSELDPSELEQATGEEISDFFAGATSGERIYDDNHRMLWASLSMEREGQGRARALVGVKLTEVGLIRLTGCASEESFDTYAGMFREAFANLAVDESIRYIPQITDDAPVVGRINIGRVLLWVVEAVLIGGVLWWIKVWIVRRLRSRKTVDV